MSVVSQHVVGSESFFSKTPGIGGKLRKKSEDFEVEEVVSIPGRSHWIWMQDSPNGKHQIVKIKAKKLIIKNVNKVKKVFLRFFLPIKRNKKIFAIIKNFIKLDLSPVTKVAAKKINKIERANHFF